MQKKPGARAARARRAALSRQYRPARAAAQRRKQGTGGRDTHPDSEAWRRMLGQLVASLALFLAVYIGRGVFPQAASQWRDALSQNVDFGGAFQELGTSLSEGAPFGDAFSALCLHVMGASGFEAEDSDGGSLAERLVSQKLPLSQTRRMGLDTLDVSSGLEHLSAPAESTPVQFSMRTNLNTAVQKDSGGTAGDELLSASGSPSGSSGDTDDADPGSGTVPLDGSPAAEGTDGTADAPGTAGALGSDADAVSGGEDPSAENGAGNGTGEGENAGSADADGESGGSETADKENEEVVTAMAQVYNDAGEKLPNNVSMEYYPLGLKETVNPVEGRITSEFGYRISPITNRKEFHLALDIAVPDGTEVKAYADGVVEYIGKSDDFGLYLSILHDNNVSSFYAHCSKLLVSKGQTVSCGETVALSGHTGNVTGPHLHFLITKDKIRLNPAWYVDL